jgi:hypothetical protein
MQTGNTAEKMHGRPVLLADEVDAFSPLHRAHPWNHGRRRYVKQTFNRRDRRTSRAGLRSAR